MANTWNKAGTTWGYNSWESDTVTVSITGFSITATLDPVLSFNEEGWGRDTWGAENWGESAITVPLTTSFGITASLGTLDYAASLTGWGRDTWGQFDWGDASLTAFPTGLSMTGSVGTLSAASEQGWGRAAWGDEPWGDSNSPVVTITTSFGITASLGTLPYAQSEEGWGRDEWGIGNWGENTTTVADITGLEMTGHQGPDGWGAAPWDEMVSWGGGLTCETTQLSVEALTGIEGTLSLGTPTISRLDMIFDLTTSLEMSVGIGTLNINNGADHSQGLASLLITGSVGSLGHEMAYDLTGIEATMSLGTVAVTNEEIVYVTGISMTAALGSLATIDDMAVGLSGLSITGSIGTFTITDMQVGLSGLEISGSLGSGGVSPLHYKDVDITGNTSYTYVEHSA
mgnify:CR=1 FL=1